MSTILLAVDGTKKGLETVATMGRLLKDQKEVRIALFHCVQQVTSLLPEDLITDVEESTKLTYETQEKVGQAVLKACLSTLTHEGFPETNIELRMKIDSLDPAQDIIDQADIERIRTIAVGRRGRTPLLLGSVAAKVAQYSRDKAVWIVDSPVRDSKKVMISMEGVPEVRELSYYTADLLGPHPDLSYTFMHIVPPIPPTLWDDGHILSPAEQKIRLNEIEKWSTAWTDSVNRYMAEGRDLLLDKGVADKKVERLILQTREGIDRDLLNEIDAHKFQIVVMGKKSFREKKPLSLGIHTSRVLQNTRGVILCLVC